VIAPFGSKSMTVPTPRLDEVAKLSRVSGMVAFERTVDRINLFFRRGAPIVCWIVLAYAGGACRGPATRHPLRQNRQNRDGARCRRASRCQ